MALQLNPRFPLVWRSPDSLQLGVDSPPVVLEQVTNAQERIIAALVTGVTLPGLNLIAEIAGASERDLAALMARLQPAMGATPTPAPRGSVAVIGKGSTAGRLRVAIASAGLVVAEPDTPTDIGVMVAHYVVEPDLVGFWLRRDLPHLPIVFADTGVQIGPIIEPGSGPCLYCLELHRTDADPAWPAIASQLLGRTSAVEDAIVTNEVVAIALRLIVSRLAGAPAEMATSIQLDSSTGLVTHQQWLRHPECGCAALPGSDSAADQPADPGPLPTRRDAAAAVPA